MLFRSINKNVYAYVERYGLDSADAYCAVFDRYVKSPLLVKNFETLCNRWQCDREPDEQDRTGHKPFPDTELVSFH